MTWLDKIRAEFAQHINEVAARMNGGNGPLAPRILKATRSVAKADTTPEGLRAMILEAGIDEALAAIEQQETE